MKITLSDMTDMEIKTAVAKRYAEVALTPEAKFNFPVGRQFAESVGYSSELLDQLPVSLWESFTGAGNPQPFVDILPGEVILDLGCGAGLDLYLYTQATGPKGKVYGLDLSAEMIAKAEKNLMSLRVHQAEFLWASADHIPLSDGSVDLVTANGIYNLSANKRAVMKEVARVLKPSGRTIFSEILLTSRLPVKMRENIDDWFRCIGGALPEQDFLNELEFSGLSQRQILWKGRNARAGHPLAVCAVIKAVKG